MLCRISARSAQLFGGHSRKTHGGGHQPPAQERVKWCLVKRYIYGMVRTPDYNASFGRFSRRSLMLRYGAAHRLETHVAFHLNVPSLKYMQNKTNSQNIRQ